MGTLATIMGIAGAAAAVGGTTYNITEAERQKDKVKRDEKKAKLQAQTKINERQEKISGMKTRLFSTEGGYFGQEVDNSQLKGN